MPDPLPWDQFTNTRPVSPDSSDPIVVIGAGLAGCWMARTLAESGASVVVLDQAIAAACGASSNPAGIVKPFVTRSPCLAMNFYVEAHRYLIKQLHAWNLTEACNFTVCGVSQLVEKPYPQSAHYEVIAATDAEHEPGLHGERNAIHFKQSGWLNPAALCNALLEHPLIKIQTDCTVSSITNNEDVTGSTANQKKWHISLEDNPEMQTSHLVVCAGVSLPAIGITSTLPVTPARGQISRFALEAGSTSLQKVVSAKHYVIPDGDTVMVGATFNRDDTRSAVLPEDDAANLAGLAETLPALRVRPSAIESYAGVRATTPDRLPLVGPLFDPERVAHAYADLKHGRKLDTYPPLPTLDGAYVLGGLGSRGIVTAPFAAKLLADLMLGGTHINAWSTLINPARFLVRRLKRHH